MLRLVFTYDKEVIIFDIDNKNIIYRDRKWPSGVKFIPKDEGFVKTVMMSRNRISNQMITWINEANAGKSLAEWQSCVDDAAVAEVVKRDARLRGCVFRKMFTGEELEQAKNSDEKGGAIGYVDSVPYTDSSKQEVK